MARLLEQFGSFRRLMDAYWHGQLATEAEREVEGGCPKEFLIGYKPLS